jgi:BA14K-like protein
MKIFKTALMASVVAAGMGPFSAGPVSASPLGAAVGGLVAQLDDATAVVPVYFRGRGFGGWGYRGGGFGGGGLAAGIIGSVVMGGIIASQRPYYSGYYGYPGYYGSYGYSAPYYGGYGYGGSGVAYCMSRFKSYNPASGTYLGYDGYRHACP